MTGYNSIVADIIDRLSVVIYNHIMLFKIVL